MISMISRMTCLVVGLIIIIHYQYWLTSYLVLDHPCLHLTPHTSDRAQCVLSREYFVLVGNQSVMMVLMVDTNKECRLAHLASLYFCVFLDLHVEHQSPVSPRVTSPC